MSIEITKKDLKILAELAFIGDWMVNAVRLHKERVKKYHRVCDLILKQYLDTLSDKENRSERGGFFNSKNILQ